MEHPTNSQFQLFANLANPNRVDMNAPPVQHDDDDDESEALKDTPFVMGSDHGSRHSSRRSSRHSSRRSEKRKAPDSFVPSSPKRYRPSSAGSQRSTTTEARKLGLLMELKKMRMQGVHLTREYSTGDSLEDIEFEFSRQKMNMDTVNSVALMRDTMRLIITGIELGNERMGPFLNLSGWSSTVTSDMSRYDHCLERIYKMYFRRGSINPIVELGFLLMGSMFMHHFKAKFTGPPPVQRNVPFEVPRPAAAPSFTQEQPPSSRPTMRRPTMRPPKQTPAFVPPPMAMNTRGMPRMGMPRPPPPDTAPEITQLEEPPKIIDTANLKTKRSKTANNLTVEKAVESKMPAQGATLNFDEMSDEES